MRNAETILSIIRERGRRKLPLENIYRQLYNRDLYLQAYSRLYRNHGAMTPGATSETVDGMALAKIDAIIAVVREERYRWTPVRRTLIPKKSGKLRALGLPTWSDKLLQEVIRLILEAFYEPQFDQRSHGFRPGRGCHTALAEVQRIRTGTKRFVEGDIARCFDAIGHTVLLDHLRQRVHANRFVARVGRLLQAGYLEDWRHHRTFSGTPQGGVASPVLADIYLHEFDRYVTRTLIPRYARGTQRAVNPAHQRICNRLCYLKGKPGHAAEVRALVRARRRLPSKDPNDPTYRRLGYVRYADDFLRGVIGTRREADRLKQEIRAWLAAHLHLTLSDDTTLVTHASSTPAHFLGYGIITQHSDTKCTNGARAANGRSALRVPADVITRACQPYLRRGKPIHRPERTSNSDFST